MRAGRIVTYGTPEEVITEETIGEVYRVTSSVLPDPHNNTPMVVPLASVRVSPA